MKPSEDTQPESDPNSSPDIHQPGVYKISGQVLVLWLALTAIYGLKALALLGFNSHGLGNIATTSFLMLAAGFVFSYLTWFFSGKKPFFAGIGGIAGTVLIYIIFTVMLFQQGFLDSAPV